MSERSSRTEIHYEIILRWSKQDQAFIAEVPELAGCAADGATYQEALANVEVFMQEWIDTARERGRPISELRGRLIFARRGCSAKSLGNPNPDRQSELPYP